MHVAAPPYLKSINAKKDSHCMYIILFHTIDFMRTAFQCQPVFTLVLIFIGGEGLIDTSRRGRANNEFALKQ